MFVCMCASFSCFFFFSWWRFWELVPCNHREVTSSALSYSPCQDRKQWSQLTIAPNLRTWTKRKPSLLQVECLRQLSQQGKADWHTAQHPVDFELLCFGETRVLPYSSNWSWTYNNSPTSKVLGSQAPAITPGCPHWLLNIFCEPRAKLRLSVGSSWVRQVPKVCGSHFLIREMRRQLRAEVKEVFTQGKLAHSKPSECCCYQCSPHPCFGYGVWGWQPFMEWQLWRYRTSWNSYHKADWNMWYFE